MKYLTGVDAIRAAIASYTRSEILWLDTEVADFQSSNPRLSLIQILDDPTDLNGDRVIILDVLDRPELINEFIEKISSNQSIEKVFHNANYDLRFLGKRQAKNITCTLEMVKKLPYYLVPVPNRKLKTLAERLCKFPAINKSEQCGDWSQRPLTLQQLDYAKMDPVHLACVHQKLLQLSRAIEPEPKKEDLAALILRYRQLEHRWKQIDTEINHVKERLKKAMRSQEIFDKDGFHLSIQKRTSKKVSIERLAELIRTENLKLDLSIPIDKNLAEKLGESIEKLPIEEETQNIMQLKVTEIDEEDLPF